MSEHKIAASAPEPCRDISAIFRVLKIRLFLPVIASAASVLLAQSPCHNQVENTCQGRAQVLGRTGYSYDVGNCIALTDKDVNTLIQYLEDPGYVRNILGYDHGDPQAEMQLQTCVNEIVTKAAKTFSPRCAQEVYNWCGGFASTHDQWSVLQESVCVQRLQPFFDRGQQAALSELNSNTSEAGGRHTWTDPGGFSGSGGNGFLERKNDSGTGARLWACAEQLDMNEKAEKTRKSSACSSLPQFQVTPEVNNISDSLSYCVIHVLNQSPYQINCSIGGYHVAPYPGGESVYGWALTAGTGDICAANVTCKRQANSTCPGEGQNSESEGPVPQGKNDNQCVKLLGMVLSNTCDYAITVYMGSLATPCPPWGVQGAACPMKAMMLLPGASQNVNPHQSPYIACKVEQDIDRLDATCR